MKRPIWFLMLTFPIALVAGVCVMAGAAGELVLFWLWDTEARLRRPARPDAPTKET